MNAPPPPLQFCCMFINPGLIHVVVRFEKTFPGTLVSSIPLYPYMHVRNSAFTDGMFSRATVIYFGGKSVFSTCSNLFYIISLPSQTTMSVTLQREESPGQHVRGLEVGDLFVHYAIVKGPVDIPVMARRI